MPLASGYVALKWSRITGAHQRECRSRERRTPILVNRAGPERVGDESVDHAPAETPPCDFEFAKTLHA